GAVAGYGLDPARMTMLGHSNGANFAAAVLALHPQAIRRAALLRPLPVLETPPRPDLSAVRVLSVTGRLDPLAPRAEALEGWLRRRGAEVEALEITAGHALDAQDEAVLADWLARG